MSNSESSRNITANDIRTADIVSLLNDISKISENNFFDRIISYCEKNDLDVKEVGDRLAESDQVRNTLHRELVRNKIFKDDDDYIELDEW